MVLYQHDDKFDFQTRFRTLGRDDLPKGYTPYTGIKTGQMNENDYDRYDSDYEGAETPDRKKSCCEIGRLSNLKKRLLPR